MAYVKVSHELLRSECSEVPLELTEHVLNGVEVRSVRQDKDEAEAQPPHLRLRTVTGVDPQVVHEQTDFVISIGRPQPSEVLEELVDVHRPLEDLVVLLSLLFRDAAE